MDGAATPPKPKTPNTSSASGKPATERSTSSGADTQAKPTASEAAAQPSTEGDSTPSQSSDTTDEPGEGEQSTPATADASSAKRGPRYDLKSFRKWAEENPEQAAEIGEAVFKVNGDIKQEWIRVQNKVRKIKGEARTEREKAIADAKAERDAATAAKERAEQIASGLKPMADMWAASQRKGADGNPAPDFDMIDESFQRNTGGLTIDDYMRMRARRGVASPELARERATRLRLEAELAQLRNTQGGNAPEKANGAAETRDNAGGAVVPASAPAAAPAAPSPDASELWGGELPKGHALRKFAGWENDLHQEMQRFYDADLDEYSKDPEDVADAVLQRKLAELQPEPEEPAPRRVAAPKRPNTPRRRAEPADAVPSASALTPRAPRGHRPATQDDLSDSGPTDMVSRERWALERAQRRLRGEHVE